MTLILVSSGLIYIALLFAIALWGEKKSTLGYKLSLHPWVYGLSLAIYCTTWTYYGAVGNAIDSGWSFLPILLGPILLYLFALPVITKMVMVSKQQNSTSIADFIASRYGKSHRMALVVTLIAAAAIIPYIALQLKAVGLSFNTLSDLPPETTGGSLKELAVAILMALFAIMFGTRRMEVTEYRSGMMLAIAFESIVKLVALCGAALFGWILFRSSNDLTLGAQLASMDLSPGWSPRQALTPEFFIQLAMAAGAILCLPRQFHVTVVDNVRLSHLKTARWLFPLYLALTSLAIAALAVSGQALLPSNGDGSVLPLLIPFNFGQEWLAILVYIGGISAATAMVIIATLTLSTMISNDVIMPIWLTRDRRSIPQPHRFYRRLLRVRRYSITLVLLLGWACYHLWVSRLNLVSIGLLAFSVVLQLLPAMIGGLYWRKGHAQGVYMGLVAGLVAWILAILLPLTQSDPSLAERIITHGTVISLGLNTAAYILFSYLSVPALVDKIQATAFVQPRLAQSNQTKGSEPEATRVGDLILLMETFLGSERSAELLIAYERHAVLNREGNADSQFTDYAERSIAGVLGAATARSLIHAAMENRKLNLEEVVHFFDDTTQALQTQQSIMYSSLENLAQGISVVDKELRLVVWNRRYLELFDYPDGMVQPGRPIADLIRYNAERGECGVGDIDELVAKRLRYMQQGSPHRFIRRRSDGRVIEMVGNPLPHGGFVTSFTDVTEHIETQNALEDANIDLEARIRSRTDEVREINRELTEEIVRRREVEKALQAAKAEAEAANASKTRFLALASHDILQPLNAARLYLSAVDTERLDAHHSGLIHKVDTALDSTEHLLSALLSIAKMDQGAMQPQLRHIDLDTILGPLVPEYQVLAEQRKLKFKARLRNLTVFTDPTYLRRIIQNFVSNAIKYTDQGKVLLAVRKRGNFAELSVWDTGPGIPQQKHEEIFEAFIRLHKGSTSGVGLGLSVAKRMAEQLNCPLTIRSELGQGSCFTVLVPLGDTQKIIPREKPERSTQAHDGLQILCVDDDGANLEALNALLTKWNCSSVQFTTPKEALQWAQQNPAPDGVLLDYQLGEHGDGLSLWHQLQDAWKKKVPGALVTAVRDPELKVRTRRAGLQFLAKPVRPAQLKALLQHMQRHKEMS
ncbi:PAS domain-containing hybrid sensor histidine kinase/response regulator [Aliidiomarina sanyensis]|uniref:histidine kinase n=1 Tax=Aliidiomarina sanyensis TaxID=1249555 RepID=A0A432WG44_9GAMM|nr:PAS domain-containing hybrid sensor histidine kinase/response regulator [Aliidiomarina sanyensis]RUO32796.1 hybrid sensor histidine kinase/response regulator [Aliidiomarina sanyensis]